MTLRTVTYDTATHKIVPLEPTNAQITSVNDHHEGGYYLPVSLYLAMIAAAPEYQEPTKDES